MDRESSDEEEDDQETLINQHQTKLPQSTFHIDETHARTTISRSSSSNTSSNFNKSYLFAIILPLVFIILFFSLDTTSFFTGLKIDSSRNQMRESELQAFYLLKQQQSHLLNLWNRTLTHSRLHFGANSNNSSVMLSEDVRSVVLNLIRLNKEVQQALLSSHRLGNLSVSNSEFIGYNGCPRAAWVGERKTIEWNPKKNKYLFAICVSGQMSNHLVCLEKHMFFAALLNRTLVIPSSKVDYWYHRVIDVDHINQCLGRKVVMSFEEFSEMKKQRMRIDRFICYVSLPQPCYVDGEHAKKIKSLGVSVPKLEPAWVEDVKNPKKTTVEDVMKKFSCDDEVLGIGDVFFADVEKEWITQPGGPLSHQCKTLIEPSRLIRLTAQRFIQTFLGKNFVALHFRRHGFLKFCNAKKHSCFFPIPQAANCITRVAERANTPVIYLSTDAAESETDLLQSLTMLNGKIIPLVKRPARNFAEKWDALLYRHGLEGDSQVEAMLDKTICAMSSVFIGSSGSTFTEDIFRLRKDWQTASDCDEYLCQDERPNFIADSE